MGAHRSPLWSSWGRGVSFMELITESCKKHYACVRGNNKRSSDPHGHPTQASDLTSPQVQNSKQTDVICPLKQTAPLGPYASWITPVDK